MVQKIHAEYFGLRRDTANTNIIVRCGNDACDPRAVIVEWIKNTSGTCAKVDVAMVIDIVFQVFVFGVQPNIDDSYSDALP